MSDTEVFEIDYHSDLSVAQANVLVRSKQDDLTILEAKLIRLAVSQIVKDDADLKTYSCSITQLAEYLNINTNNIYRDIQTLSTELMRKYIYIKTPNPDKPNEPNYKLFHWVETIEYDDGTITFKLNDNLKPYLVGLDRLFTLYPYSVILTLPNANSIRFYELMCSYERLAIRKHAETYTSIPVEQNEVVFTIEELREIFNCGDKYSSTNLFFKRVIDPSIEAVREYAGMYVKYRTITSGKGKKITHVIFKRLYNLDMMREIDKREKEKNQ